MFTNARMKIVFGGSTFARVEVAWTFDTVGQDDVELQGGDVFSCELGKIKIKIDWESQPFPDLVTIRMNKK